MASVPTINIRHRVGPLGRATIRAVRVLSRVGIRLPVGVIGWAIFRSSQISINGGPWVPVNLNRVVEG